MTAEVTPRIGVVGARAEPARVALADTPLLPEMGNAVLSLGFYAVCAGIGLLPGGLGRPVLDRWASWAASIDERRDH